jgi:predicted DNA-binding transcriptional regulator YafY
MPIMVDLTKEEAEALLTFLRTVSNTGASTAFANASEKVRTALRDVAEPDWQDEMAKEILRRAKDKRP